MLELAPQLARAARINARLAAGLTPFAEDGAEPAPTTARATPAPDGPLGPEPPPPDAPAPGRSRPTRPERDGPALIAQASPWIESQIPPRPWIAPGYLLRGAVTVLAGPPGASKSTVALNLAAAIALGREWGRFRPLGTGNALILSTEDDHDEQRRRLSAVLRHFGARPADVRRRLVRVHPAAGGALFRYEPPGSVEPTSAMDELETLAREHRPDLVVLDPLAELHSAPENDNGAVHAVMAGLRGFAADHQCAVLLLHHTRKGIAGGAGDPDIARGASSIIGAARIVLTLLGMTGEEADSLGIPRDQSRHYVRLDGAKSNYSALGEAEWFDRASIMLDNGDWVAALAPWTPPADTGLAEDTLAALLAAVATGDRSGQPWSARLGKYDRSVSRPMAALGITSRAGQNRALDALFAAGVTDAEWSKSNRHPATGLRHPDGRPTVSWAQ
jgi:hypothetical protein